MALTAKQEKFAQGIVAGLSQADAYRQAYDAGRMKPESVQQLASRVMGRVEVRSRVEALRVKVVAKVQAKAVYGIEQAMIEADEAIALCKAKQNGGAMVSAVTLKSKLNGLLVERHANVQDPWSEVPAGDIESAKVMLAALRKAKEAA
jgi:hypothetical protein